MQEVKAVKKKYAVRGLIHGRSFLLVSCPVLAALLMVGLLSVAHAGPEGGVVRAGSAQISEQGGTTLIRQSTPRAIIDWRNFGILADERVQFAQPSSSSATLNRVTGDRVSVLLGRMDANGQILLINPNGIIFGQGAQINVGGLIASTANIRNENFLEGKLVFDEPGRPGAGIINSGSITAAEGGLVALVAPHVRNDGLIQARLGKVILGAADTFTIDLYGDGLVNFALSEASLAELKDGQGQPVKNLIRQTGTIDVGSGKAVLVTAEAAKGVLDSLINMSGTILADSAVQEGGRIQLLARGGNVDVSGHLSARGTTGGQIDVLGDQVHLFPTAKLDADGAYGGGAIHIGGAYRGSGDTYRSQYTLIDAGATLQANAGIRGRGGEVVVWSNGETSYTGSIEARGGTEAGDGGLVEVSGKQNLLFDGLVDAGASHGNAGSLLLDPYNFIIGTAEAGLINRVLRTGTSTSVSADNDIFVNSLIDGRGRITGGGLTLSAGHDININDYLITSNGAINLLAATGTVSVAPGKAVYAGTAPITVRSGGTLTNAPYLTGGLLSLISTQGSVNIDQGIDSSIGNLLIQAAGDVNVNQPIVSLSDGNTVNISAGNDVNVNAQIDGRPALGSNPIGAVTMVAGQNINLNRSILANGIDLTASLGTIHAPTMTAGTVTLDANGIPHGEGLFAGTGPISVTAGGNLSSGVYVTTGPVSLRSTGGDVTVDTKLAEILGNLTVRSDTGSVNVNQEIANIRSGSNLAITAGNNINLNRQIDALDDSNHLSITPVPGGSVTFTAGNNVNLNRDLGTYNGPVDITATTGTLNIAWNGMDNRTYRIQTGSAPITVTTGGDLSSGTAPPSTFAAPTLPPVTAFPHPNPVDFDEKVENATFLNVFTKNYIAEQLASYVAFSTTGKLSLTSTGGNVTVDAPISNTTGEVAITAGNNIVVNHKVFNNNNITLTAGTAMTPGTPSMGGIRVNSTNDAYGIPALLQDQIDALIADGKLNSGASIIIGPSPAIDSGSGPLKLQAVGDVWITTGNGIATKGKLTIDTRGKILQGSVFNMNEVYPSEIELVADGGIDSFFARYSPKISASSLLGDIHLEGLNNPGELDITATAGSVYTGGWLGSVATLFAGQDINFNNNVFQSGILKLTAGRYANLSPLYNITSLDVTAGSNIYFNTGDPLYATVWLNGGDLKATSTGGNIAFGSSSEYSAVHIDGGRNLTLNARGSVELGILETLGPVSITAQTGNITLRNDIGPPIPVFDPETILGINNHIGVASLILNAGGNIDMRGAKAAGTLTITAGGALTPTKGIFSGTTNGITITANGGALEKLFGGDVNHTGPFTFTGTSFGDIPLGTQAQLAKVIPPAPAISAGPAVAPPNLPMAMTALPAQPPDVVNVAGSGIPGASSAGASEQEIDPRRVAGTGSLTEIIPEESEDADEGENKKILKFSGGRGAGQEADFGRR
jgi:filamentous hemagglutinin family protein